MKTVLLATLDYPPRFGGIAAYLSRVAEQLPNGAIHVLAPEDGDTHHRDVASPVPIYRRRLEWRWIRPRWLPALYWTDWLRRRERPSLLLVSHLLPMGTVARLLKRFRGVEYAVIVHGMDIALAMDAGGRKREEAKRVLAEASLVIANSAYTASLVAAFGIPNERVIIIRPSPAIPDAAPSAEKVAEIKTRYGLDGSFTLLSVGRLVARKGFASVIDAVAAYKEKGIAMRALIVGDGPERGRLERHAGIQRIADRVVFTGSVADQDLPALYAASDVFVMVPKSAGPDVEGFGIVYLEANMIGKPVIGSRAGGVADAVIDGETGLLVDPGNLAALIEAIEKLRLDPALRASLGERGRLRVQEQFGWERQIRPFIEWLNR